MSFLFEYSFTDDESEKDNHSDQHYDRHCTGVISLDTAPHLYELVGLVAPVVQNGTVLNGLSVGIECGIDLHRRCTREEI